MLRKTLLTLSASALLGAAVIGPNAALAFGPPPPLYDALGPGYTLIRFDPTVRISELVDAAAQRDVPLAVLNVDMPEERALYARKLVLVRPDQHVAWRGDEQPAAPLELIDLVRGGRTMPARKVA